MKMKKILLSAALCLASLGLAAQNVVSHNLSDFNQIVLSGKMNVVLEPGDRNSLEVTLHNTEADRFSWNIGDGKLNLRLRANTQRDVSADVRIVFKRLNALEVSGASVRGESPVTDGIFALRISNGGHVTLETRSKDVSVQADGNSAATLSGETLYLDIRANSKAKIDARALQTRSAIVTAQFNAEVFVWATERLEAKANSNSVVYYKGTPEIYRPSTATMGSVEQFSY